MEVDRETRFLPLLLNKSDIVEINKKIMALKLDPGDIFYLRDDATLDYVVYRFYDQWSYPACAATLIYHIAKNQIFGNGNKRTAIESAKLFLDINGKRIEASEKELEVVVLNIAEGKIDYQKVLEWSKDKIKDK